MDAGVAESENALALGASGVPLDKDNTPCEFKPRRPHHNPTVSFVQVPLLVKFVEGSFLANLHQLTGPIGVLRVKRFPSQVLSASPARSESVTFRWL